MDNTIVTIGDINYIWGIFLLIASARKAGMKEPFLVGVKKFTPEAERVLGQFGEVKVVPLDGNNRSLACLKAHVMLQTETEFVTWADSDAFFTGNVSDILVPSSPKEIHFRLRAPSEMPDAFKGHAFGEDGRSIPKAVLDVWRRDIKDIAGEALEEARYQTAGSACFCAFSMARFRRFVEIWHELQLKVLPDRDVGVVDKSLLYYHQLDESTLIFVPEAEWQGETVYSLVIDTSAESRKGLFLPDCFEAVFSPDDTPLKLLYLEGKDADGFPVSVFNPHQEIDIDAGDALLPERTYTFGFVFNHAFDTAEAKEQVYSGIKLKGIFPPSLVSPKVVSQFWSGDNRVQITYTGFEPEGRIYSLDVNGLEKIVLRTR